MEWINRIHLNCDLTDRSTIKGMLEKDFSVEKKDKFGKLEELAESKS